VVFGLFPVSIFRGLFINMYTTFNFSQFKKLGRKVTILKPHFCYFPQRILNLEDNIKEVIFEFHVMMSQNYLVFIYMTNNYTSCLHKIIHTASWNPYAKNQQSPGEEYHDRKGQLAKGKNQ